MADALLGALMGGLRGARRGLEIKTKRQQAEAEAAAKEEKTKRLAEEKDIEAAFSQIEGLRLLDPEIASSIGMYQLQQSRADRPMKPLDQYVIKGLFSQKEEITEQEAAEAEERELAEALRKQPTAFGEAAGEMGYLEQDVSGMLMGEEMGELDPFLAELGLSPAQRETPTGRQEIGAGVGLIGRSIEDYLAQDKTPTEGEFSTFLTERRGRVEEREAVRAGELAGVEAAQKSRVTVLQAEPRKLSGDYLQQRRQVQRDAQVDYQNKMDEWSARFSMLTFIQDDKERETLRTALQATKPRRPEKVEFPSYQDWLMDREVALAGGVPSDAALRKIAKLTISDWSATGAATRKKIIERLSAKAAGI